MTLEVSNFERTIDFYEKVLKFQRRPHPNPKWAELEGPGILLGVTQVEGQFEPGRRVALGLQVDSVEETKKELEDRGIKFSEKPFQEGPVRLLFFNDPDGVPIYLCEGNENESYLANLREVGKASESD